jgi:hypothetical protein
MDWSVNEKWRGNRRDRGCLPGLHSHFMAEWKPEHAKVLGPGEPLRKSRSGRQNADCADLIDS